VQQISIRSKGRKTNGFTSQRLSNKWHGIGIARAELEKAYVKGNGTSLPAKEGII
jgi:hypothetical protein